jgi:hypothetical protein
VSLTVTDSQSRQKTYQTTIDISEPQGFGAALDGFFTILILIIVAVVAAALVGTFMMIKRRNEMPPKAP